MSERLRVLVVSDKEVVASGGRFYSTGGSPKEWRWLSREVDLHVLASVRQAPTSPPGLEELDSRIVIHSVGQVRYIHSLPPVLTGLRVFLRVRQSCQRLGIDVVIGKAPREVGMVGVIAARTLGLPTIFHYSYDWLVEPPFASPSKAKMWIYRWYRSMIRAYRAQVTRTIARRANLTGMSSNDLRLKVAKVSGVPADNLRLMQHFFTLDERYAALPPLDGGTGPPRITFIGRLDLNKNVHGLLRAFALLHHEVPKAELWIVGDGPERARLECEVERLGVSTQTTFHGQVPNEDVRALLGRSWVLALPSFSEGLPQVILEALAAGRPVVASRTGGIPELVRDGVEGYLVEPGDWRALAHRLRDVLMTPGLAARLGTAARVRAMDFTPERCLGQWIEAIRAVRDRESRPRPVPVLFLIPSLDRGGTEEQLTTLINRLDHYRFPRLLCCLEGVSPERMQEVRCEVLSLGINSLFRISAIRGLLRIIGLIRRHGVRVVHACFPRAEVLGVLAARLSPPARVILGKRNLDPDPYPWYERALIRLAHSGCDVIVANAAAVKDRIQSAWNVPRDKIAVIHNGVDLERFMPTPAKRRIEAKQRLGFGGEECLVAMVTHLVPIKGVETLVDAAALVVKEAPDARFMVLGGGHLLDALRERARSRGMEQEIHFPGEVHDVVPYLQAADIGVLTSQSEGLPNAILEYMAMGLPVVATDVGGVPELLGEDGECGFLVPAGASATLAAGLLELMRDPERQVQMGRHGRLRAERLFGSQRMVSEYEEICQHLASTGDDTT